MSEKKQIKEMARTIFESRVAIDGIDLAFAAVHGADMEDSHFMRMAAHLYRNGYRKASDIAEVRHGSWKKRGNEKTCSRCKFIYCSNNDEWNFCPNCGADMKGAGK